MCMSLWDRGDTRCRTAPADLNCPTVQDGSAGTRNREWAESSTTTTIGSWMGGRRGEEDLGKGDEDAAEVFSFIETETDADAQPPAPAPASAPSPAPLDEGGAGGRGVDDVPAVLPPPAVESREKDGDDAVAAR
mmetsp:Transcript_15086/g.28814  ORF Transcript_15086/g.28814 Transcript_15086/m.28814 type:complete len:134 (-) Transcript_15086:290-691(-)